MELVPSINPLESLVEVCPFRTGTFTVWGYQKVTDQRWDQTRLGWSWWVHQWSECKKVKRVGIHMFFWNCSFSKSLATLGCFGLGLCLCHLPATLWWQALDLPRSCLIDGPRCQLHCGAPWNPWSPRCGSCTQDDSLFAWANISLSILFAFLSTTQP